MAFKIAKAATSPAALNLKLSKSVSSPASSLSADQIAKTDLITGASFSAPDVSQKVISGAALEDIGRADQIIGGLDRGHTSALDHALGRMGLETPSPSSTTQIPGNRMMEALDPESFISGHDRRANDASKASGSDRVGLTTAKRLYEMYETASDMKDKSDKAEIIFDGSTDDKVCLGLEETTTAVGAAFGSAGGPVGMTVGGMVGNFVGSELCQVAKGEETLTGKAWTWVKSLFSTPNPEDDGAYGDCDISGKPDPLGVLNKLGQPIERLAGLNPTIDPLDESYGHQGTYTGPSLGAVNGSNGGTSTGSWNNPYGFGGYSGPSIDAIGFSHGGTSTGTFDPLF